MSHQGSLNRQLDPPPGAAHSSGTGAAAPVELRLKPPSQPHSPENHLLQVRLGIASSLFMALRSRHLATATHSLRVTLGCASWALMLDMSEEQRDIIEVASLLHDIGKIGVPDSILLKPGSLTPEELAVMDQHRRSGVEILRASCANQAILDIVGASSAWYGGRPNMPLAGEDIPLGARMLAIVDAFDAMTTDQVYRRAISRELAFSELFRHAGTQFDPQLVKLFVGLHEQDQTRLHEQVARRWLQSLDVDSSHAFWKLADLTPSVDEGSGGSLFQQKLLDNMRDAVVFVDTSLRIMLWNPGAERMTGIAAAGVLQRRFVPRLLEMRDEGGFDLEEKDCPLAQALASGEQRMRRMTIRGRGKQDVSVEAHVVPVIGSDNTTQGATIVMRDVSPELSLEARCHSLHEMATKDPLTQVANRAEFNRVHRMFVAAHLERRLPCSLIICDIDHFKSVNDTYGHPAGDDVLKSFAKLLKTSCRSGDLVARYGGEEFVMLCADCDNATAARRAEEIRRSLSQMPQPALGSRNVMASFGVTEIQLGDTPATMLARADRALYDAKERGRNNVVQLGSGIHGDDPSASGSAGGQLSQSNLLAEQFLATMVPMAIAIEKLRGFVADHDAEVVLSDRNDVRLKVGDSGSFLRRTTDRQVPFLVDLHFEEEKPSNAGGHAAGIARTTIYAAVTPQRSRDRRRAGAAEHARTLLASLRAYLMATEEPIPANKSIQRRTKRALLPWLSRRS
jgi:diguanylate cyclase (GGDEF)-like protein/PAS domain S-box-containing protein